jgi:hypothetical protein
MTEQEWLTCDDASSMLASMPAPCSCRKLTLYICAGVRSLWSLLYDERSRNAVDVLERKADARATADEVKSACFYAESPTFGFHFDPSFVQEHRAHLTERRSIEMLLSMGVFTEEDVRRGQDLGSEQERSRLLNLSHIVYHGFSPLEDGKVRGHLLEHLRGQEEWPKGNLVREIFGNSFRRHTAPPSWPASVVNLAAALYAGEDCSFALRDALLEAGHAELAEHFTEKDHPKGCWVVDLLLGRS